MIDHFLEKLLTTVNGTELELPITLNVSGLVITGDLVSGHRYFEGFAQAFTEGAMSRSQDKIENLADSFRYLGFEYAPPEHTPLTGEPSPPPPFVHLKNARIYLQSGEVIPGNAGVWWRGRLDAVDGFFFSKLANDGMLMRSPVMLNL
jgi:hypothetical protein